MKLFLEKKNQKFNPEVYTKTTDIDYTETSNGFKIDVVINNSNTPQIFTFDNEIPCEIGEQCIISANITHGGLSFNTHVNIYHDGNLIGDLITENQLSFTRTTNEIEIRFEETGSTTFHLSDLQLTRSGFVEVEMIDTEKVSLTKEVKDFSNIGDVKAGFSNNITIKYSISNNDSVGYFTNVTNERILKLINGVKAVMTTDYGDKIADGVVTIKNIERMNETFFAHLFFTSFDSSFFKKLSDTDTTTPHVYVNNDWQSKVNNMEKEMDNFENDEDPYIFGMINDNNKYEYKTASNQFNINTGAYVYEIQEIDKSQLTSQKNIQNNNVPWSHGYSDVPNALEPMVRIKYLMNEIHNKYGYKMEGSIFNDPKLYNLVTNPILKEVEVAEIIPDIKFSDYVEWTCGDPRHKSKFLYPTTTDSSNYNVVHNNLPIDASPKFDVNDADINNYKDLYGNDLAGHTPWYLDGINWKKNFTSKDVKVNVKVRIDHNNGISGYFRIIIADGFYNSNGNYAQMNPYSWMITEDMYLNQNDSIGDYVYFEKDIVIKDFQGFQGDITDDAYFIRVNIVNDIVCSTANPIHTQVDVTYSEIRPNEGVEMGNSYYLDDKYTFTFTEQQLMKDIINKFNLIPIVNTIDNIVTYYTYEEFYDEDIELNWEDKIIRDKKILYDYSMKDAKSIYYFENNCKASNYDKDKYDLEHLYGQYELKTLFINKKDYKIENKIDNLFFDIEPDKAEPFGIYDKTEEGVGGFPLVCSNDTEIKDQTIYCGDGLDLEDDRVSYKKKKVKKSLIGYAKNYRSKTQSINGIHKNYIPLTYKNKSPYYTLLYKTWTVGYDIPGYYMRYMGPFNEISSSHFEDDNIDLSLDNSYHQAIYNSLTFDKIEGLYASKDLYDEYKYEMENILYDNTHTLEAFFNLSETEYKNISMREKILIDGNRYIIKKISNFSPKIPVKITLMTYQYQKGIKLLYTSDGYSTTIWTFSSSPKIDWYSFGLSSSNYQIGFTTVNHTPGKKYKIKIKMKTDDGGWVKGIYRNGEISDLQSENTFIGTSYQWYEFEYIRTDTSISTPTSYVSESLMSKGSTNNTKFYIGHIEIYQVD